MSINQHAQDVLDFITMNPHIHDQGSWYHVDTDVLSRHDYDLAVVSEDQNICNTTMCIAGTSAWLVDGKEGLAEFDKDDEAALTRAAKRLGLSKSQADSLFYTWDDESAKGMLSALANGDMTKFREIHEDYEAAQRANWDISDDDY